MKGALPALRVIALVVLIIWTTTLSCIIVVSATTNHTVPWDLNSDLNLWSSSIYFYPGDHLVFSYLRDHDVVVVNEQDYNSCRTERPISVHKNGLTVIPVPISGKMFIICGKAHHCTKGLKLEVQVQPPDNPSPPNNGHRNHFLHPSVPPRSGESPPPRSSSKEDVNILWKVLVGVLATVTMLGTTIAVTVKMKNYCCTRSTLILMHN